MKGQEGKKGWSRGKKPVFQWNIQQNVLMCIYLSWRSDVVKQGLWQVGHSHSLDPLPLSPLGWGGIIAESESFLQSSSSSPCGLIAEQILLSLENREP